MSAVFDHEFSIEHVGPLRHGHGGKAAATRFRAVCVCGYATKWRKFSGSLEEDRVAHMREAEAAGQRVSRRLQIKAG